MYVYEKSDSIIEKKIAWITKAKYWRGDSSFEHYEVNFYENNCKQYLGDKECFHTVEVLGDIMNELNSYCIGVTK